MSCWRLLSVVSDRSTCAWSKPSRFEIENPALGCSESICVVLGSLGFHSFIWNLKLSETACSSDSFASLRWTTHGQATFVRFLPLPISPFVTESFNSIKSINRDLNEKALLKPCHNYWLFTLLNRMTVTGLKSISFLQCSLLQKGGAVESNRCNQPIKKKKRDTTLTANGGN